MNEEIAAEEPQTPIDLVEDMAKNQMPKSIWWLWDAVISIDNKLLLNVCLTDTKQVNEEQSQKTRLLRISEEHCKNNEQILKITDLLERMAHAI